MRKKLTHIFGILIITLFLLIPNVVALPEVYLNTGDTVIWHLEASAETELESGYQKMNISAIDDFSDKIFVNFSLYDAEEDNYTTYGWENDSIWDFGLTPGASFGYLNDSIPESHYKYYFNEQNAAINNIPIDTLTQLSLFSNPALIAYAIIVGFGVGFGTYTENITTNTTTIIQASPRNITFDTELFTALEVVANPGEWLNFTITSSQVWIYGETSNILRNSSLDCTMTITEYNDTLGDYQDESAYFNLNFSAVYPQLLVDDVPIPGNPLSNIPGYPLLFLSIASLAGIFFIVKKKLH